MKHKVLSNFRRWIESFKRGRQFVAHDIWRIGLPGEEVPNGLIIKQIRAIILLARGLMEETILLRASALTFATLLFIVPFLALMFFLIQTFNIGDQIYQRMDNQTYKAVSALRHGDNGDEDEEEQGECAPDGALVSDIDSKPLPPPVDQGTTPVLSVGAPRKTNSDEQLKQQIIGWVFPIFKEGESITEAADYTNPVKIFVSLAESGVNNPRTVGLSGLIFILTTVFGFMRNVEYTLNRIWSVKRQRNLFLVISHYMMITLFLPFVAASIMGMNAALENPHVSEMLGSFTFAVRLLQFLFLCLALTLIYYIVPNTKVHFRYALLGGIVGSLLFLLNSWAYVKFQMGLVRYTNFFFTFALFPLLLMYIYISWIILLSGSLVSFAYQNEKTFAMERLAEGAPQAYREFFAIRLMMELAYRHRHRLLYPTAQEAAELWNVPTRIVSETLEALHEGQLVTAAATTPVTYQPRHDPRSIKILDVLNVLREHGQDPSRLRNQKDAVPLSNALYSGDAAILQKDMYTMAEEYERS
ncbi:MAG: YihY/virulence factor BrkB family protein [Candidatus Hydrogenedentales bacterium]|jgi:membrane protein